MISKASTRNKKQISVSIDRELVELADQVAKETNSNRSEVISSCLKQLAETRKERLMIEYYRSMSPQQDEFLEKALPFINDVVKDWGD